MNVVKLLRPIAQPVKLIRCTGTTVQLIRPPATTLRLVNEKGVVNLGGVSDASELTIKTDLKAYYNLQKQC